MFSNIIKLLTNFIEVKFKPIKSSVTKTWPSQLTEEPIPIVGIFNSFVIFLLNLFQYILIQLKIHHFFEVTKHLLIRFFLSKRCFTFISKFTFVTLR